MQIVEQLDYYRVLLVGLYGPYKCALADWMRSEVRIAGRKAEMEGGIEMRWRKYGSKGSKGGVGKMRERGSEGRKSRKANWTGRKNIGMCMEKKSR